MIEALLWMTAVAGAPAVQDSATTAQERVLSAGGEASDGPCRLETEQPKSPGVDEFRSARILCGAETIELGAVHGVRMIFNENARRYLVLVDSGFGRMKSYTLDVSAPDGRVSLERAVPGRSATTLRKFR